MTKRGGTSNYNYRHSEAYRESRHAYNQQPEVQMRNQIKRAVKHHQTPAALHFHAPTPPKPPRSVR